MAGILDFEDYIGGADEIQIAQIFPSTQKTYLYDFNVNITGWTFEMDHQTIVVDRVTFDRNTGEPNFANSVVKGFFAKAEIATGTYVTVTDAVNGMVSITIPGGLYTGPILPDARQNVPITIVGITWTTNSVPAQINTHRWAFIQSWEPDVTTGDPTLANGYTAITLGSV